MIETRNRFKEEYKTNKNGSVKSKNKIKKIKISIE